WQGKNYLSIHAEKRSLAPNYRHSLKFYVPGRHLSIAEGSDSTGTGAGDQPAVFSAGELVETGAFTIQSLDLHTNLTRNLDHDNSLNETHAITMTLKEQGSRNIIRKIFQFNESTVFMEGKVFLRGEPVAFKVRYALGPDNSTVKNAFDIIINKKTSPGDTVKMELNFSSIRELDVPAELFEGKFRSRYTWSGLVLPYSTPPYRHVIVTPVSDNFTDAPGIQHAINIPRETMEAVRKAEVKKVSVEKGGKPVMFAAVLEGYQSTTGTLPSYSLQLLFQPGDIAVSDIFALRTIITDLVKMKPSSTDLDLAVTILGDLVLFLIVLYFGNFFFLLFEIVCLGLFIYLAGKLSGTDLFSKVFFPKGRKLFSITSGYIFSLNALLVPLRIVYYILSGIISIIITIARLHPAINRLYEKKPEYIAPEIRIETFKTAET
ncbi:MAG TPA: hypothetical protein PK253_16295, partial [Spirochaetota bacterium]|nr:hypothetical protein [Spirochaetota bacterium]